MRGRLARVHRIDKSVWRVWHEIVSDTRKGSRQRTYGTVSRPQWIGAAVLSVTSLGMSTAVMSGELDKVCLFNIEAQPLDKALLQFGAQAHVQLSVSLDSTKTRARERRRQGP